jgi:uncharacterized protein DUF2589
MANIPAALRDLPLDKIISAPMEAAIRAQAMAAQTTVDFIKQVGMKPTAAANLIQQNVPAGQNPDPPKGDSAPSGDANQAYEAQYVEFKFDRVIEERIAIPAAAGAPATTVTQTTVVPSRLTVPLLAIVPIPYIRINDMTIAFEYTIKDMESSESTSNLNVSAEAKASYWFFSVTVKGSYSNQNVNKRETDQSATLKINVNAVQDQMPEGLGKVLDILQQSMKVVPLSSGSVIPIPPPA